jgi:type I pantothenate kinase
VIDDLATAVLERLAGPAPHIVGVAGAVAAGKTTVARSLAQALQAHGRRTDIVSTDSFLLPNSVLHDRELGMRKGFPETFDAGAIDFVLSALKSGVSPIRVPVYSHAVYDILPGEYTTLEEPDVVLLEGIVALQDPAFDYLDSGVYVDADEADVVHWFTKRFRQLTEAARSDESSFYRLFVALEPHALAATARSVWDSINGPNLHEHILPTRERAHVVVEKAADHTILRVRTS